MIELLVVIAIIAVLAGILMPAIGAARRSAQEAAVKTEIRSLELAMTAYFQDYAVYPPDQYGAGTEARRSAQALVRYLDPYHAGVEGYAYFEFDLNSLTSAVIGGDGGDDVVFLDLFPVKNYYRYQNNDVLGAGENGWYGEKRNRTSVDIWAMNPYDDDRIGNW